MQEHPLRAALRVDPRRFQALPASLRAAILRVFEQGPARGAGQALGRLLETPWWSALSAEDRRRAIKIVAYLGALPEGARPQSGPLCRRRILEGTLASLVGADAVLSLAFEDLPLAEDSVVAGLRRAPGVVVLNRRAIAADDRRLGLGHPLERRVGIQTLVHEVNHLCNPTAVGPTHAAFMDEYRAWLVDTVATQGQRPGRAEALRRCRDVLRRPAYAAVGELRDHAGERARVLAFLRRLGPFESLEQALDPARGDELIDDPRGPAPLPDPLGTLDNDALRALAGPRA